MLWNFSSLSGLIILCICCATAWEIIFKKKRSKPLIGTFSLKSNCEQLFTLPKSNQPGQLGCLNGIRVLSTCWIVLCHAYGSGSAYPNINMQDAYRQVHEIKLRNFYCIMSVYNGTVFAESRDERDHKWCTRGGHLLFPERTFDCVCRMLQQK